MRKRNSAAMILAAGLFLIAAAAGAQQPQPGAGTSGSTPVQSTPRLMKFSGALEDASGQPLTGTVGVTFSIYPEQQGGTALWLETQNVTPEAQGHYTVMLGATQSDGMPVALFTASDPRWLGVEVQLPGEVEQPRVLLVSVPYALKAADADTIGGMPASAFVLAAPVTIGSAGTTSSLQTQSAGAAKDFVSQTFALAGTGTQNYVTKWIDSAGTLGNSVAYDNGTYLGIGTTAPTSRLTLGGETTQYPIAFQIQPTTDAPSQRAALGFGNWLVGQDFGGAGTQDFFIYDGNNAAVRFYIDPTGHVGIGTSASSSRLTLGGETTQYPVAIQVQPTANATSRRASVAFDNWQMGQDFGGSGTKDFFWYDGNAGAARMYIDTTGRVGFGTTAPTQNMEVAGTLKATTFMFGDNTTQSSAATITGVTAGTGLSGGGTSGTVALSLLNSCSSGQLLKWSGSAWACAADNNSGGTITAVTAGAGLTPAGTTTSGPVSLALTTAALTRNITYLGGCDDCSILTSADNQNTIYINLVGDSMTIGSVTCFSNAGAPVINVARYNGTTTNNILSSALTCSTTGATSTSIASGQSTLNPNDQLNFVMVTADGVAQRVTVSIVATLN